MRSLGELYCTIVVMAVMAVMAGKQRQGGGRYLLPWPIDKVAAHSSASGRLPSNLPTQLVARVTHSLWGARRRVVQDKPKAD